MEQKNKYAFSLFVIGTLFFVFGYITWVNSIVMPFLKEACNLTTFEASFVPFCFYISYFVMGIPASLLIRKIGYSGGMMIGLLTMACGSIMFVPAAITRQFGIFLTGQFFMGAGLTVLQAATNPYATILGPIETAARRISIMGVCNKFAGVIGIYTIYKALFSGLDAELAQLNVLKNMVGDAAESEAEAIRQHLAEQVILPYIIITAVFMLLVVFIKLAKLPRIENTDNGGDSQTTSLFSRKYTYMWLGVGAIFFYVGAEVIAIDYLIPYGKAWGVQESVLKGFPTYAMFALIVGYFVGLLTIPKMISQRQALVTNLFIACALALVAVYSQSIVHVFQPGLDPMAAQNAAARLSIACIIMLSFAHAIMWPAIWPLSIHDLGKHTELASGLLVMAVAGGGVMSLIYGKLCEVLQGDSPIAYLAHQKAYLILFVCYFYILFFATIGYKFNGQKKQINK